ncbi:MAG: hypothetical protein K2Z81_26595, partial [Cyanobacteria bacterium]|nr:hypothetical protein [Cyanobacteriota bacterium]
ETSRSSYWPSLQDYNEAIQNLSHCMGDRELRQGTLHVQQFGLPYVVSGAFACVYRVSCGERSYAVRCFATPIRDQAERYKRMGGFICGDNLSYTMDFQFVEKGIMLRGEWFPIVKMEWVEGESLGAYISRNLNDPVALTKMRRKFLLMVLELEREGVAHGDLQHGNIIIRNDELILVDYDGMFVPDLAGFVSREKGHRNYQHPARGPQHFGRYLDNFSAWLIDTALYAISLDSSFWSVFHEGDECMLFRAKDLLLPNESLLFRVLHAHKAGDLSRRGEYLRMLLSAPVEEIPPLGPGYPPLAIQEKSAGIPAWMIQ